MPELVTLLLKRARHCPVACGLKILFVLLFLVALDIALYHQAALAPAWYLLLVAGLAVVAALMLSTNSNCRMKVGESAE